MALTKKIDTKAKVSSPCIGDWKHTPPHTIAPFSLSLSPQFSSQNLKFVHVLITTQYLFPHTHMGKNLKNTHTTHLCVLLLAHALRLVGVRT